MGTILDQIVPILIATVVGLLTKVLTNELVQHGEPSTGVLGLFSKLFRTSPAERTYLATYRGGVDTTSIDFQTPLGAPLSSLQTPVEPASWESVGDFRVGYGDVHLTIEKALHQHRHILLLGQPGSGKTSFVQYISRAVATESGRSMLRLQKVYLPVLVSLREAEGDLSVASLIKNSLPERLARDLPDGFLYPYLESGRCFLLFDGLDEVPAEHYDRTVQQIAKLGRTYPSNYIVVTSRPSGVQPFELESFEVLQVARPTRQDSVRAIVDVYFRDELGGSPDHSTPEAEAAYARALRNAREFVEVLFNDENLRELASDPFWLNILAVLYRHEGRVPRQPAQILDEFCGYFLNFWDSDRSVADQLDQATKVRVLGAFAFWLQEQHHSTAPRREATTVFRDTLRKTGRPEEVGDELLQTISLRSGLIVEYGPDQLGFAHRTFLEFFAAKFLLDLADGGQAFVGSHEADPSWHGVVSLWREMTQRAAEGGVLHS